MVRLTRLCSSVLTTAQPKPSHSPPRAGPNLGQRILGAFLSRSRGGLCWSTTRSARGRRRERGLRRGTAVAVRIAIPAGRGVYGALDVSPSRFSICALNAGLMTPRMIF
jgi:hypothetical protein